MPRIEDDPSVVFRYLMERSGVLRAPVEDRVDFVHRTFQEYLAAEEAMEQDHAGLLVQNAHQDQWREVVILAAGHATLRQRETLLQGLLQRGEREPGIRHRVHLLAVACLETSPEVPAELTTALRRTLSRLIPPMSMPEAQDVASAGQLAVPLLREHQAESGPTVAACVRALALIGGDHSLHALIGYGHDNRVEVVDELLRAWDSFDLIEFAMRVLADSPLRHGLFHVTSRAQLPALQYLRRLRYLVLHELEDSLPVNDLEVVRGLTSLVHVDATIASDCTDLSPLATLEQLQQLEIANCAAVSDLRPLSRLTALQSLTLRGCNSLIDLTPLADMRNLKDLTISEASNLHDLSALANLTRLQTLNLSRSSVADLAPLAKLWELRALDLSGTALTDLNDLRPLGNLRALRTVNVNGTAITDPPVWLT
jgi:hypothetical protein